MSNRFLIPISFASKMGYWSPVIWKVKCVKVEDIKVWLLRCLDIPPVNYYSISKQEGFIFLFNPKLYSLNPIEHNVYPSLVGPQGKHFRSIWLHLFIGTLNKTNFLNLEKYLNQEWAFFQLEGTWNQNC